MTEFLALIFSLFVPAITSWLKRCDWPAWQASLVAVGVSLAGGVLAVVAEGGVDWQNVAGTSASIFTMATLLYQKWFKHTALNAELEAKQVL